MKAKNVIGKIYVSSNAYLGHSETFVEVFVEPQLLFIKSFLSPPPTQFVIDQKKSV